MPNHIRLDAGGDQASVTFDCGELPADEAVEAVGHTPNGYFWEGLLQYVAPDLVQRIELDSEAGMFAAYGDPADLDRIVALLGPYLDDGERVAAEVRRAEAAGFVFDD